MTRPMTNDHRSPRGKIKPAHYSHVHYALRKKYGPAPLCVFCQEVKSQYQWANVTDNYTDDIQDYLPLCCSCHLKFDYTDERKAQKAKQLHENRIAMKYKVAQYDKEKLIKIHNCLYDAARSAGRSHTAIWNNIQGLSKSSAGFRWRRV